MVDWNNIDPPWKQHPFRWALHKLHIVSSPSLSMMNPRRATARDICRAFDVPSWVVGLKPTWRERAHFRWQKITGRYGR